MTNLIWVTNILEDDYGFFKHIAIIGEPKKANIPGAHSVEELKAMGLIGIYKIAGDDFILNLAIEEYKKMFTQRYLAKINWYSRQ